MSRNTFTGTQTIINSHPEESQTQNKMFARLRAARGQLLCVFAMRMMFTGPLIKHFFLKVHALGTQTPPALIFPACGKLQILYYLVSWRATNRSVFKACNALRS